MVNRFETDVIARHPTVVVILAGTNDVYPGWTLCGGSQSTDSCDNIMWMVSQAEANGIQPILATIPPWGCKEALCAPAELEGVHPNASGFDVMSPLVEQALAR
jgi:lysophospholipase L1-like esterase